jgi:hypothetical protein
VATLIDKTVDYGMPKTHMHCMKILFTSQKLVFGGQCLTEQHWVLCCLNRKLLRKIIQFFFTQLIALLEENERDKWFYVSGLPMLQKQQEHSCRTSLVTVLSGVVFGHHGS